MPQLKITELFCWPCKSSIRLHFYNLAASFPGNVTDHCRKIPQMDCWRLGFFELTYQMLSIDFVDTQHKLCTKLKHTLLCGQVVEHMKLSEVIAKCKQGATLVSASILEAASVCLHRTIRMQGLGIGHARLLSHVRYCSSAFGIFVCNTGLQLTRVSH